MLLRAGIILFGLILWFALASFYTEPRLTRLLLSEERPWIATAEVAVSQVLMAIGAFSVGRLMWPRKP